MNARYIRHGLSVLFVALLAAHACAQVFLPGTQPEEADIRVSKVKLCRTCHARTPNGDADPYHSWQGGMMAQAARDPVYMAALAIANQDIPGVGEFCIRCHAPAGWMEGRSKKPDGSELTNHDRHGVQCDVCHRLVDPATPEATKLVKDVPPGYGSGMMVLDPAKVARGPYDDCPPVKSHKTIHSPFHASGNLCGTCHDVSNPLAAKDIRKQKPYEYGVIERTYSEWLLSDFSKQGSQGSCQSCHYPPVPGGGIAARQDDAKQRDHFVPHGPVGGSTWVQDAVWELWKDSGDVSRAALDLGKKRAKALLKTSAKLDASFPEAGKLRVRITNLTGHKLPTGYPEGRRMWLNARFLDNSGKLLTESGAYGNTQSTLRGEPVTVPTLLDAGSTQVYECLPGISEAAAKKYGKKPGKSFHFVLNDTITFDNRIPPKGFNNARFIEHGCQPIGKAYKDGQNWDDVHLTLPEGCTKVEINLRYQSVSWEYLKFLVEENRTDEWGNRLYQAWLATGKCPPETIATITIPVKS